MQWLNNCVGRKNYATFICLMASSLVWVCFTFLFSDIFLSLSLSISSNNATFPSLQLVIEAGVGIAILVLCFVKKKSMEAEIMERLGNGFTRPPFATVVVSGARYTEADAESSEHNDERNEC